MAVPCILECRVCGPYGLLEFALCRGEVVLQCDECFAVYRVDSRAAELGEMLPFTFGALERATLGEVDAAGYAASTRASGREAEGGASS